MMGRWTAHTMKVGASPRLHKIHQQAPYGPRAAAFLIPELAIVNFNEIGLIVVWVIL
jgi:hypothetical protein